MKQKQLLIAFTALVLTACGGSIDLGPKIPAPPITEPEEPVGRELVHYPISMETDAGWESTANWENEDDVAPSIEWIENGIQIYSTNPNQQMLIEIAGPLDAREGTMVFTISADADYLATATGVQPFQQVFTRDPGGDPDEDVQEGGNWSCFTGIGDWEADTEVEVECNVPGSDMYDLAEDQYMNVGIQSQGADVEGYLRLHHIEFHYWVGEPEEDELEVVGGELELPVDDTGEWSVQDDDSSLEFTENGVAFTPVFSGEYGAKLVWMYEGPVNFEGQRMTVEFIVEQAFLDDESASIAVHAQQHFGSYVQHQCSVDKADLTAGEPFTAVCEGLSDAIVAEEGETLRLGINVSGSSSVGAITITGLKVTLPSDNIEVDVTEGWDAGSETMDYTEDGARYFPTGDGQQFFTTVTGPLVMDGGNFVITVSADQDFIDSGAAIQPFAQGIESGGIGQWSCWINGGDNLAEGSVDYTCEDFDDFEIPEGESAKFGIQAKPQPETAPVAGSVTVHSLIINPGE